MTKSFTSSQVSQRSGLTPRQLQWWDEQGIVVPARQGHRRLYSAEDLAELSILSDLRRRGFSLQRIRRMVGLLRREFGRRVADLLGRGPALHLLTDGESVFLCDTERGVIDLLRDTQQPLLAICIGPVLRRVLAPQAEANDTKAHSRSRQKAPLKPKKGLNGAPTTSPRRARQVASKSPQVPKKGSQSVKAAPQTTSRTRSTRWR
jgi:DNA-binding transcriptional MerR regulator